MRNRFRLTTAIGLVWLASMPAWAQQPVPRSAPVAGSVVSAKGGENVQFVSEPAWRNVEIRQDLKGGDTLRTNDQGNLAILFADQTQIRVGRNSTLTVNSIASASRPTEVELPAGNVWARAARGGGGVVVKTPAAAAAIRGTDWSLSVDKSGRTSLVVLEGTVVLSNAQGSVTVNQGEGAIASIGQAPTKIILVRPKEREQMLFYVSLRDAFTWLPATTLDGPAQRAARDRIKAMPATARRAEDWLIYAEVALRLEGRAAARAALASARAAGLEGRQRARADLVDAMLASGERRWKEAEALFRRALPGLDAQRRVSASYGLYVAAAQANPHRRIAMPQLSGTSATAAVADAFLTGFTKDLQSAADKVKAALARHPNDPQLLALQAGLALTLDRREEVREAAARAAAIDPDDPQVVIATATVKAELDSDIDGAVQDLRRGLAVAPGSSEMWNGMGLLQSERDAVKESDEAFQRAIELDPEDPVPRANYAIALLDQSRVEEAGALIDRVLAIDPGLYAGYIAKGRYHLQRGEQDKAVEMMLAGSAANPAYSQAMLALAIAYHQQGEDVLAQQQLDAADRLDPFDPVVSQARTAIAIDQYRADDAVANARESIRRYRARGGYYAPLARSRTGGSILGETYRLVELREWGRYYTDRVYDAFQATGYFDQASTPRLSPIQGARGFTRADETETDLATLNSLMQGLFLDPLAVSGRLGRADLFRRPFLDAEIGGGFVVRNNKLGATADTTVQGFTNTPIPTSYSLSAGIDRTNGRFLRDGEKSQQATMFVGAAPTALDRFVAYGLVTQSDPGVPFGFDFPLTPNDLDRSLAAQAGGGWSHTFGDRNVLNVALVATYANLDQRLSRVVDLPPLFGQVSERRSRTGNLVGAVSHTYGFGDVTLRTGVEGLLGRVEGRTTETVVLGVPFSVTEQVNRNYNGGRVFADATWRPNDMFMLEAGAYGTAYDAPNTTVQNFDPRIGAAFQPFEGQWLRAAYRRETALPVTFTLSPIATVGLVPDTLPSDAGGRVDTTMLRWDAEWSAHLFTSLEYQRLDFRGLDIGIPQTLDSFAVSRGQIERLTATANVWLGHGIGLFGSYGGARSRNDDTGLDVPLVPERNARFGFSIVHPSRVKFTLAENYVGRRDGDLAGFRLPGYWTTDAALTWETKDRRLETGVSLINIFDEDYQVARGVPGSGRTVVVTAKARF